MILFLISATIKPTEKLKALMSFAISRKHKVLRNGCSEKREVIFEGLVRKQQSVKAGILTCRSLLAMQLQPRVSKRLRAFEKDADTKKNRHNQKQLNSTCLKEIQTPREKTYLTQLILRSLYTSVKSTKCE